MNNLNRDNEKNQLIETIEALKKENQSITDSYIDKCKRLSAFFVARLMGVNEKPIELLNQQ